MHKLNKEFRESRLTFVLVGSKGSSVVALIRLPKRLLKQCEGQQPRDVSSIPEVLKAFYKGYTISRHRTNGSHSARITASAYVGSMPTVSA